MRTQWFIVVACLLLAACSRQEAEWRQARGSDAIAAYEAYLERYPAGGHAEEARARVRELQEEREWERARRLDTPEALQRYLGGYPAGRHAAEARARLDDFLLARAPDGDGRPAAAPAQAPDAATPWAAQLGAFGSREAALAARSRLSAAQRDLLEGRRLELREHREGGRALWRLRASAAGERDVRALCAELILRGEACQAAPGQPALSR